MRILTALLLMLVSTSALAATTLQWTPPTERIDGVALDPATDIAEYRLYCGDVITSIPGSTSDGSYSTTRADILPGYGTYDCHLTAVDTDGLESGPSNTVSITWDPAVPNAPTELLIIVE